MVVGKSETWTCGCCVGYMWRPCVNMIGFVDISTCIEKTDLVVECRKLTWPLPNSTEEEAHQCRICFDRRIDVVLIPW